MKNSSFFLLLLLLIGGGIYLTASKIGVVDSIGLHKGNILPSEDWHETLIGTWKYRRVMQASFYCWVYEGEVEYLVDGSFKRSVTCKYYEGGYGAIKPNFLHIISGGTYSGKWEVSSTGNYFTEHILDCDMDVGRRDFGYEEKSINFCEESFAKGVGWAFGDVSFSNSKFNLKEFNETKIAIEGKLFAEDASVQIVFTKEK